MDINRVINNGTPSTLEELVQKLERAGRDGSPAEAILYYRAVGKISLLQQKPRKYILSK